MNPIFRIRLEQLLEKFSKDIRQGAREEIAKILTLTKEEEMPLTLAATIIHMYQYNHKGK